MLQELISKFNYDPACSDEDGNAVLHTAAQHGQYEVAKFLITNYSNQCPIDHRNSRGLTALHCACIGGHTRVAKILVDNKADITIRDENGDSALKKAFLTGHKLILFELFNFNLHKIDSKLLLQVCEHGYVNLLDVLLSDFHLDPSSVLDDQGNKPIHIAALRGHKQVITLLIKKYKCPVDVKNKYKQTPLHMACSRGHLDVSKVLVSECVLEGDKRFYNVLDKNNNTPLDLLIKRGDAEAVHILSTEYGLKPHVRGVESKPLLHQLAAGGFTTVLQELISKFNYDPACSDEDGNTVLHTAAQHGQNEIVKFLITNYSNQVPIDHRNCRGLTALHCACICGHARIVKLIANKALGDKDEKALVDECGNTLLHIAAQHGRYKIAKFLITNYSNQCPIDHRNSRGLTALHCACIGGHTRVAKILVDNKADITVRDEDGDTPLKKAFLTGYKLILFELFNFNLHKIDGKLLLQVCEHGYVNLMDVLLSDFHLDPSSVLDDQGNKPIHIAALQGHKQIVTLLVKKFKCPVDVKNKYKQTPLHMACSRGHLDVSKVLVSECVLEGDKRFYNALDKNNSTPLDLLIKRGDAKAVHILSIEYGLKPRVRGVESKPLLHQLAAGGFTTMLQELISKFNYDPACSDEDGNTVLHAAAQHGQYEIAKFLITNQVLIDHRNCRGLTALHYACMCGHARIVKLIANKALGDKDEKALVDKCGNTLLHIAAQHGQYRIAEILFSDYSNQCPIDHKNSRGQTALHCACIGGHTRVAKFLVDNKADITIRDEEGDTPLKKAFLKGHELTLFKLLDSNLRTINHKLLRQVCERGSVDLVDILLSDFHLKPSSVLDDQGNKPIHIAALRGHKQIVTLLVKKYKCPVDVKNKYKQTPLHIACSRGHLDVSIALVSECILEGGKRVYNSLDKGNNTPLDLLIKRGDAKAVHIIFTECGYKLHIRFRGAESKPLLHQLVAGGFTTMLQELISKFNYDPACSDEDGNTVLHTAAQHGQYEIAKFLITNQVLIHHRNCRGQTALHCACISGHTRVAKILVDNKADITVRDEDGDTPLKKAFLTGHKLILFELFNFNLHKIDSKFLRKVCERGYVNLIDVLLSDFHLDPSSILDDQGNKPIHIAALRGHKQIVTLLVMKYKCPVYIKNKYKQTPLHIACSCGHLDVSIALVSETVLEGDKGFYNALDKDNNTPLDLLIKRGDAKAVHILSTEYGCRPHVKGVESKPLLHQLAAGGFFTMLQELISKFNCDPACSDEDGNTVLHTAAQHGQYEIAKFLITNQVLIDHRNCRGQIALHYACMCGHARIVKLIANKALGDKNEKALVDKCGNTLLHIAAQHGQYKIAEILLSDYSNQCPIDHKNSRGQTALHCACIGGHTRVAKFLVANKADITIRDEEGDTPLKKAFLKGHELTLFKLLDSNLRTINHKLLRQVCERGSVDLVDILLSDFHLDPSSVLDDGNKPIHIAALRGHKQVIALLVKKYKCPVESRGFKERSLLHHALRNDHIPTAKTLIDDHHLSLHCIDEDGNTPLHLSSLFGRPRSVGFLLYEYHAPVYVQNKAGKTALNLATGSTKRVIREYVKSEHKRIQQEYKELRAKSLQKYSGQQVITRVFVLGNPGSGKSTLVKSLKQKWLSSLFTVTKADIPPHTAGIVPSVHQRKETGRLLYFDFAGDQEYYSSHAAILEMVSRSTVGSNVFLVVADLTKDDTILQDEIGYWLSFISYHGKALDNQCKLKVIVVLSHSDCPSVADSDSKVKSARQCLQTHINLIQCNEVKFDAEIVSSNCRSPRSSRSVASILQQVSKDTPPCSISYEASLLHGLLEKDFVNVVTCKFQNLLSGIEETGIYLPSSADALHPIVRELHNIGLLMLIGRNEDELENYLLLLNPSSLTNEVHEKLFSSSAVKKLESSIGAHFANMGILPESYLASILPEHITKECLVQLQYCQEFNHAEVGLDYSVTSDDTSDCNLLYFPALCKLDTKKNSWHKDPKFTFGIGWYAECTEKFDYFPARYLHVLLLRLAYAFALPIVNRNPTNSSNEISAYSRRCTMWKNGIHWLMEERVLVECIVEIVNDNKGIVVITYSKENTEEWAAALSKIIDKAMQEKAKFCNDVSLHHYVLKPKSADTTSSSDPENLFDIHDIERVIKQRKNEVMSVGGNNSLDASHLRILRRYSYWGRLHVVKHC